MAGEATWCCSTQANSNDVVISRCIIVFVSGEGSSGVYGVLFYDYYLSDVFAYV